MIMASIFQAHCQEGMTEITKWQYGRKGAVSVTYDDGSINQFVKAVPIMNELKIPGTFFIITGAIPGSEHRGKFIGRPVQEILNESKKIPANEKNFYERASAARFLGYKGTSEYFTKAGAAIDAGRFSQAYGIMDELYRKVNNADFPDESLTGINQKKEKVLTWEMVNAFAGQGHEFGSHMVDHPYLGALDEPNMLYEIEKSREEIIDKLGPEHTFSAETPYCSQDERVLKYTNRFYPAVRSRLSEEHLMQIRFSSHTSPVNPSEEYVCWQRGTYTRTPLQVMKAWVDTTANENNIWLVLIIHGIDGIGWEPIASHDVDEYFRYIKSTENTLWFATYGNVTRYIRERMNADVSYKLLKDQITVTLTHSLDKSIYNHPLTLRTVVRPEWKEVTIKQGKQVKRVKTQKDGGTTSVLYEALPNAGDIKIKGH